MGRYIALDWIALVMFFATAVASFFDRNLVAASGFLIAASAQIRLIMTIGRLERTTVVYSKLIDEYSRMRLDIRDLMDECERYRSTAEAAQKKL